ncbi:MAG: tetratricopeptide repeat protein [Deltaproteobacteria bacterium]|nr:tetratricopeptide repeat protein [Deltaproteobacteria bacterium]
MNALFKPETALTRCRKNIFGIGILFFLIAILYSNTFHVSWQFDDTPNILDRKELHLTKLHWHQMKHTFYKDGHIYRPISCLSFALNYYAGRDNVVGYHLVNTGIHLMAAIFLFLFIRQSMSLPVVRDKYQPDAYSIALIATILWAANPVQTQAVTYIVQRMTSLGGMFYIMAMFFFLKGRISSRPSSRIVYYTLCGLSALMSFGSKENTILLPVSLFLFDIMLIRGASLSSWLRQNAKWVVVAALIIVCIGLAYLYLVRGSHLFSFMGGYRKFRVFTLGERLLTEPRVIMFYLSLLFYPNPNRLCINHDILFSRSLFDPPTTFLAILTIVLMVIGALIIARKRPLMAFAVLFFFINHIVEFEHRNYVPSMLIFIPMAALLIRLISRYRIKPLMHLIIVSFTTLLIMGYGNAAYERNVIWRTKESIWLDSIEKYPDLWRPYLNLGNYYVKNNQPQKALFYSMEALSKRYPINTGDKHLTYYNIGVAYQKLGQNDKALFYYDQALKIHPFYARTHLNKGVILTRKGHMDLAIKAFKTAIRLDREEPLAYTNLGILFIKKGLLDEALEYLEKARKLAPDNNRVLKTLGHAYIAGGFYNEAFKAFQKAQRINPYDIQIHLYVAEIYSIKKMVQKRDKIIKNLVNNFSLSILEKYIKGSTMEGNMLETLSPERETLVPLIIDALVEKSKNYYNLVGSIQ